MIEIDLLKTGNKARSRWPDRLAPAMWSLRSLLADRWIVSCAAAVAACVSVSVYMLLSARKLRTAWDDQLTRAVQDSVRHAADLARIKSLEEDLNRVAAWVAAVEEIDRRRFDWPRIMSEVAGLLPPEAWIVRLARSAPEAPTRFLIEGRAWDNQAVARFQSGLDSSPLVADVQPVAMAHATEPAEGAESGPLYSFVLEGGYEVAAQDANEAALSGSAASP